MTVLGATAAVTGDVSANVSSGAYVVTTGSISIKAINADTDTTADATSGDGGLLVTVGVFEATANNGTAAAPITTTAVVGSGANLIAGAGGVTISSSDKSNSASNLTSIAIAGVVAVDVANSTSNTYASSIATLNGSVNSGGICSSI